MMSMSKDTVIFGLWAVGIIGKSIISKATKDLAKAATEQALVMFWSTISALGRNYRHYRSSVEKRKQ